MMVPLFSIYSLAPSIYTPIYPDGYYGRYISHDWGTQNPVVILTSVGYSTYSKFQINSDFELNQDLRFITEGLSFKGKLSLDNFMQSRQRVWDPSINQVDNVFYRVYDRDGMKRSSHPLGITILTLSYSPGPCKPQRFRTTQEPGD